jgi:DNA polymerase-3 subunit delta'
LNCRRIDNRNHPDVQWLRPESKLRVITIEQIRDLIQIIGLKPTEAEYKVAVISSADRMNVQAANAFLKTLEEPPPRSIIILLTCALDQVLETILSRCLRLHFVGDARACIDEPSQEWIRGLASTACAPQKSLLGRYRLLGVFTARLAQLRELIERQLEASSPLTRYPDAEKEQREKWVGELNAAIEAEYRRKRAELILLFQWWMRDIWFLSMSVETSLLALPELQDATAQLAGRVSPSQATENLRQLDHLQQQLTTNIQEALALEVSLLKLHL